ncbi:MAG: hypothetical protein ACLU5J_12995 [Christensenellales bacterium]
MLFRLVMKNSNRLQQEKKKQLQKNYIEMNYKLKGKTLADLSKIGRDAGIWAKRIKEDALDATAVTMTSPMKFRTSWFWCCRFYPELLLGTSAIVNKWIKSFEVNH